ncbi:amidase domain-containing protein, partial [Haematococcus lacustris]
MMARADSPLPSWHLAGLPIVVKDLTAVAGLPFTQGSLLYKDCIAVADDPLVTALKAAGAIIIGKSNTPEFGAGAHTF